MRLERLINLALAGLLTTPGCAPRGEAASPVPQTNAPATPTLERTFTPPPTPSLTLRTPNVSPSVAPETLSPEKQTIKKARSMAEAALRLDINGVIANMPRSYQNTYATNPQARADFEKKLTATFRFCGNTSLMDGDPEILRGFGENYAIFPLTTPCTIQNDSVSFQRSEVVVLLTNISGQDQPINVGFASSPIR